MEIKLILEEEDHNLWGAEEVFEVELSDDQEYIESLTHKGRDLRALISKHADYIWSVIREQEIALNEARVEYEGELQFELERGN
jgi:hypothetical protein